MEKNKYSKVRLVLSAILIAFWIGVLFDIKSNQVNLFPLFVGIIGSILFALNKKITDLISFSVSTFIIGLHISFIINNCRFYSGFIGCGEIIYLYFTQDFVELPSLLLFTAIWIYLIIVFAKRIE